MNQDYCEKAQAYHGEVEKVARFLFHAFYFDEEEQANHLPAAELYERDKIGELLSKAEKVFDFHKGSEAAINTLRFLHTFNPVKAKEIIDEL
jgi:hypothetical protein